MKKVEIERLVEDLSKPIAASLNVEIADVELAREGSTWYVKVFIDKPGGVSINDCSELSRRLGDSLDAADPIPTNYHLEVSSPGLDRPLKRDRDFERYRGREVEISTYRPVDGKKKFLGRLGGLESDEVILEERDGTVRRFPRSEIARARLHVEF